MKKKWLAAAMALLCVGACASAEETAIPGQPVSGLSVYVDANGDRAFIPDAFMVSDKVIFLSIVLA